MRSRTTNTQTEIITAMPTPFTTWVKSKTRTFIREKVITIVADHSVLLNEYYTVTQHYVTTTSIYVHNSIHNVINTSFLQQ